MNPKTQQTFLLIGFTLGFGALGFYVEEKVETYYKVRPVARVATPLAHYAAAAAAAAACLLS